MSKEFYHAMLEMDKYIQKSLETKYDYFSAMDFEIIKEVFWDYILPVINIKTRNEMIELGIDVEDIEMTDTEMTDIEIFTANVFNETRRQLQKYLTRFNNKEDTLLIEDQKKDFEEKYKQFKALLELH